MSNLKTEYAALSIVMFSLGCIFSMIYVFYGLEINVKILTKFTTIVGNIVFWFSVGVLWETRKNYIKMMQKNNRIFDNYLK